MKGIVVTQAHDQPLLVWGDAPDVTMGSEEVLVAVKATAVNRADLLQAQGNYPPPPGASKILGLEMAGVITAVGEEVETWQPGDRVCALLPGGGYAEKAVVPANMLLKLPDEWTFAQGAAVPEVWYTAYVNLFLEGDLVKGETVLLHAGASGVGTAAIQLARSVGATIFVTAGTPEKRQRCRELGAALAINYKEQDFLEQVMAATDNQGVDLILDPVGGAYLERNIKALRQFGRLVIISLLSGRRGEIDMGPILRNRLKIVGSTLRNRPPSQKVRITRQFKSGFWHQFHSGELEPVIDSIFPIQQAQAAHQYVAQNKNTGKVVLTVQ
ncbi:MAG: NAD(P)H-quinone oxidoreductase [Chloroflexi bacterium]|nr:NAD(P)H-quinone oxidoreductase [Chloroflexota bacterium]